MEEILNNLWVGVVAVVVFVGKRLVETLLKGLEDYIQAKTSNSWAVALTNRLQAITPVAVDSVYQTYVEALRAAKDPSSPGGVALTREEKEEARSRAAKAAKDILGQAWSKEAEKHLGDGVIEEAILHFLEASVRRSKWVMPFSQVNGVSDHESDLTPPSVVQFVSVPKSVPTS